MITRKGLLLLKALLILIVSQAAGQRTAYFPSSHEFADPPVEKENFWIFIMAGQSNMAGRGLVEPGDTLPDPRILTIDSSCNWIQAKEPLHFYEPELTGLDCGMSFARELLKSVPEDVSIGIIPCAVGGSSIRQWTDDLVRKEVKLLTNFNSKTEFAQQYGVIKGILWHQGEAEAYKRQCKAYPEKLNQLIHIFRSNIGNESLPVVLGELGTHTHQSKQILFDSINIAIHEVAGQDRFVSVVSTADLSYKDDSVHFDSPSQRIMGVRYAQEMARFLMTVKPEEEAEKIILDTDMGSDCDDVGAMAVLHKYAREGKAEILGIIYSSDAVPYGAGVADAINTYYGRKDIPIGASHGDSFGDQVDKMGAEELARDTTTFGHRIIHNRDATEQTRLNRSLLAVQEDHSVTYVTIGHTRGLYELIQSPPDSISQLSGAELVERKVKRWVALGALGAGKMNGTLHKDWNFFFNNTAPFTEYLVNHFPRPACFVDGGGGVMTGKSLLDTPEGNIVRSAYTKWLWNVERKKPEDQRPSWDLLTVLYAVEGLGEYFTPLKSGHLLFDAGEGCRWEYSDSDTGHHLIVQNEGTDQDLSDYLNKIISSWP